MDLARTHLRCTATATASFFALGQRLFTAVRGPKRFSTTAGGDQTEVDPPDSDASGRAVGTREAVSRAGQ